MQTLALIAIAIVSCAFIATLYYGVNKLSES